MGLTFMGVCYHLRFCINLMLGTHLCPSFNKNGKILSGWGE